MIESEIKFNHRPSSLESHMICTAKAVMEYGIPNEDTKYTTDGSNAHTLLNYVLYKNIKDVDSLLNASLKYPVFKDNDPLKEIVRIEKFLIHQQMIDSIKTALSHIWLHAPDLSKVKTELVVDNTMIQNGATGEKCTIDIVFQDTEERTLYVWDYKNGAVPVSAEENWQLLSYAKSVTDCIDTSNIDKIDMRILQPNAKSGGSFSTWDIPLSSLSVYVEQARKKTKEIDEGENLEFNPMSKACIFCKAKGVCRPYNESKLESYIMLEKELKSFKKDNSIPYNAIESIWESGTKFNAMVNETEKGIKSLVQLQDLQTQANSFTRLINNIESLLTKELEVSLFKNVNRQSIIDMKKDFEDLKKAAEKHLRLLVNIQDVEVQYELQEIAGKAKFIDLEEDIDSPAFKLALERHGLTRVTPKTITDIKKQVSTEVWEKELKQFTRHPISSKLIRKSSAEPVSDADDLALI